MTSRDAPDGYAVLIEREAPASKRQLRGGSSMSLGIEMIAMCQKTEPVNPAVNENHSFAFPDFRLFAAKKSVIFPYKSFKLNGFACIALNSEFSHSTG